MNQNFKQLFTNHHAISRYTKEIAEWQKVLDDPKVSRSSKISIKKTIEEIKRKRWAMNKELWKRKLEKRKLLNPKGGELTNGEQ